MTTERRPEDAQTRKRRWRKFGKIVRTQREKMGIGLRELSVKVNMSPTYLSMVERSEFPPPIEKKVKAIAAELDLDPDNLIARAGKVPMDVNDIIRANMAAWRFCRRRRDCCCFQKVTNVSDI